MILSVASAQISPSKVADEFDMRVRPFFYRFTASFDGSRGFVFLKACLAGQHMVIVYELHFLRPFKLSFLILKHQNISFKPYEVFV